jgi:hypothetical protein
MMPIISMAGSPDASFGAFQATGIALALSNGVAAGMAALQQDLLSLDRVLVAGAARFEALIRLADGLRTAGSSAAVPIAAQVAASGQEDPAAVDARPDAPVSATIAQPVSDRVRSESAQHAESSPPAPRAFASPEQPGPTLRHPQVAGSAVGGTATAKEPQETAAPIRVISTPSAQASPVPRSNVPGQRDEQSVGDPNVTIGAGLIAMTVGTASDAALASNLLPPAMIAPAPLPSTTAHTLPVPELAAIAPPEAMIAIAPVQTLLASRPWAPPQAPQAASQAQPVTSIAVPDIARTQHQATSDAQRPPAGSQPALEAKLEPREGLLILDGAQLGRWIMDRIARQISRPTAGTTGIDPRVSPIYPGAPASV